MGEPHLDHPGEWHWFSGYGPAEVIGPCPHTTCKHWGQSVIAYGPDLDHYELVTCDDSDGCRGYCRAWVDGQGRVDDRDQVSTPWLETTTSKWAEELTAAP